VASAVARNACKFTRMSISTFRDSRKLIVYLGGL
jgi:hypothetical protein